MSSNGLGLADSYAAFKVAAVAQQLSLLDDLWTSYAEAVDPRDEEALGSSRQPLIHLVTDMQRLLRNIQPRAEQLLALARGVGEEAIERAVDELTAKAPNGAEMQAALGLHSDGPVFANALFAACEHVQQEAPAESEELQAKLESLFQSRFHGVDPFSGELESQAGDFKLNFKCGLTLVGAGGLVVGGVILGALTGVAIGALALGAVGGGATGVGGALIAVAASPCLDETPKPAT